MEHDAMVFEWSFPGFSNSNLELINTYLPVAGRTQDIVNLDSFLDSPVIQDLKPLAGLLAGDFNAKLSCGILEKSLPAELECVYGMPSTSTMNLRSDKRGKALAELMGHHLFFQLNGIIALDKPARKTYMSGLKNSIIDYILASYALWDCLKDFKVVIRPESNHNPLTLVLLCPTGTGLKTKSQLVSSDFEIRQNARIRATEQVDYQLETVLDPPDLKIIISDFFRTVAPAQTLVKFAEIVDNIFHGCAKSFPNESFSSLPFINKPWYDKDCCKAKSSLKKKLN